MKEIQINTASPYTVYIEKNLISLLPDIIKNQPTTPKTVVVVSDGNVYPLYGKNLVNSLKKSGYNTLSFVFSAGESSKQMNTVISLYDFLSENNFTRSDLLVALGGGIVGDLTGFVAATYLRGVDYINIPSTLLAQIDSSVGGKTAVNIPGGKNLVGAFYQPKAVLCDICLLSTLPQNILNDGMAEAVKYAVLFSEELMCYIKDRESLKPTEHLITSCIGFKKQTVERDEYDNSTRMLLNFGHTLGHAIEKIYDYKLYTHGQAVALGMVLITELSEKYSLTKKGTANILKTVLKKYGLPTEISVSPRLLYQNSLNDKKQLNGNITLSLTKSIGNGFLLPVSLEEYSRFLAGEYL